VARPPKPYAYRKHFCTSAGPVSHYKLCPVEEGMAEAKRQLLLYLARVEDERQKNPTPSRTILPGGRHLVHHLHDAYLAGIQSEVAARTFSGYVEKLKPFYERFCLREVRTLTEQDGLEYKRHLMAPDGRNLGNATVNHHVRVARQFLNWCAAQKRRYIPANPWADIKYLPTKSRQRLVTREEFGHLVGQAKPDTRELITVLYHTTFRPQEVRALRWDYVQWDRNRAVIPATEVKTRRPRVVTLPGPALDCLRQRRRRLEARDGLKPYVFPARRGGKKLTKDGLVVKFRRVLDRCVKLGLIQKEVAGEQLVPYSLRHNRATELLRSGLDLHTLSLEMGHSTVGTTSRHYLHLANDDVVNEVLRKTGH
jgi:integrase